MFTIGDTVDLAKGIIDDTCFVMFVFSFSVHMKDGTTPFVLRVSSATKLRNFSDYGRKEN